RLACDEIDVELSRLGSARSSVRTHLNRHLEKKPKKSENIVHEVLGSHLMILDDHHFFEGIANRIGDDLIVAERAVEDAFGAAMLKLGDSGSHYLRDRVQDMRDTCQLLIESLMGHSDEELEDYGQDRVFVVSHMRPSMVLRAREQQAVAYITASESYSSHGAIMLRAIGIPTVGGVELEHFSNFPGETILVNGYDGSILLNPSEGSTKRVFQVARDLDAGPIDHQTTSEDAFSLDGTRVELWANIDEEARIGQLFRQKLHGIGLFRTEFMVLTNNRVPDRYEQLQTYKRLVNELHGRPLVLRSFDLGAEKITSDLMVFRCPNPALGVRGIRRQRFFNPDELDDQIYALLRATVDSETTLLIPMVTNAEDMIWVRERLLKVQDEILAEGHQINPNLRLAAMIEIPAAAFHIREILSEVDSVFVGTNDLSQYLSASDRENANVSTYLNPDHSGLWRMIEIIIEDAQKAGREDDVYICGELPSSPECAQRLVKMGARKLVIQPGAATQVRAAIAKLDLANLYP
ncbi:phosphoenolpyruvate--protein phosphotransferase, partial [Myxococcota bacterium]|nr:phosphoenolpyruvate--protein phosphotransferase [Myxococcota bacterium]